MATIKVKIITGAREKRRADQTKFFQLTGVTANSQLAFVQCNDEELITKMARGSFIVISSCRQHVTAENIIIVETQDSTKVILHSEYRLNIFVHVRRNNKK